ncbi:glycerol-3-phosphate dehydrogenase [Sphingomonas sp. DBB INV C78]|uniref:glycerol-3-phosphate dehydrogenase n=1 Tax=Sphingomonas sp. DBB INV C78 TaxID=3349434 RepID=UPI0036D3B5A6
MPDMLVHDLLIIGGGINGVGIARDAAGRGLKVLLVEQDDLASHTSSASTKLIHGGLRYLEYYEFRLVRESLMERERLMAIAPHIIHPLEFVLPHRGGGRPAWMVRLGLFLYDHLGGREKLPGSAGVRLKGSLRGAGLQGDVAKGFTYSDCRVDDARLTVLNAMDAAERGTDIRTRTRLTAARRDGDVWIASLEDRVTGAQSEARARHIVNVAGPWVGKLIGAIEGARAEQPPRLVKGSHIVVPRMFAGEHAFILQNPDKRIVFAIPYERDFTLVGTTDIAVDGDPESATITEDEIAYLCESVNRWFERPITPADVVWHYWGVRPLYDDGSDSASAVTRDYVMKLGTEEGPQILSIFGGKLTTYRKLAEHALEKIAPFVTMTRGPWTDSTALPGGDMPGADFAAFLASVRQRWPFLPQATAERMARSYGTRMERVIGDAVSFADLGEDYGGGLTEREIAYLVWHEFARTADDILWRRSKLGLHVPPDTADRLTARLARETANV